MGTISSHRLSQVSSFHFKIREGLKVSLPLLSQSPVLAAVSLGLLESMQLSGNLLGKIEAERMRVLTPLSAAQTISGLTNFDAANLLFRMPPEPSAKILDYLSDRQIGGIFYWPKPERVAERIIYMQPEKAAKGLDHVLNPENDPDRSQFWLTEGKLEQILDSLLNLNEQKLAEISVLLKPENAALGIARIANSKVSARALRSIPTSKVSEILSLMFPPAAGKILQEFTVSESIEILSNLEPEKAGARLNYILNPEHGFQIVRGLNSKIISAESMGRILSQVEPIRAAYYLDYLRQVCTEDRSNRILDWLITINRNHGVEVQSKLEKLNF